MEYPKDPAFARWYFRSHSFDELEEWTASLQLFRFCRAMGGHANDGDSLRCALRIDSETDFVSLMAQLGIALREIPADAPSRVPGRSYSIDESRRFPNPISAYPRFEQPADVTLGGVSVWAYISGGRLELTLCGAAGDFYEVTELDVRNALAVEKALSSFAERVIAPPVDGSRYFLP